MRFSLRDLDEARADPRAYLQNYIDARGTARGGPSTMRYWQYAVYRFHRSGSLPEALRHFQDLCQRSFVAGLAQQQRIAQYSAYLEDYQRAFAALRHNVFRTSLRVQTVLARGVGVSGEVSRIDLTREGGYAFCLLVKSAAQDWQNALRMPIIQHLLSVRLGVHSDMVRAGIYNLEEGRHEWHLYSPPEIRRALSTARSVGAQIAAAAGQLRYSL